MEPVSHFFFSHRLKLQFWDWGQDGKPPLILVHGGLDHARSWDWVARALRGDYHVYAMDLRGHGNSQWAPGAAYSVPEHVLDLSALVDVVREAPVNLIGHSLGGAVCMLYSGIYPDRVRKLVSIEGWGPPDNHPMFKLPAARMRDWIERIRQAEQREPRSYATLDEAVARMKEANPHLSDEVARHLTVYGTNWRSDGGLTWKFDNFARFLAPHGQQREDYTEVWSRIDAPTLLIRGLESWAADPAKDGRSGVIRNHRLVNVERAGHWVHHDRLDVFLEETARFLAE